MCTAHCSQSQDVERLKCALSDQQVKMRCIYAMEYYSAMKIGNNAICSNMNGPKNYYTN